MEQWDRDGDRATVKPRLVSDNIPLCDLKPQAALHRIGTLHYISLSKRSKEGKPFREIKQSASDGDLLAGQAVAFITTFLRNLEGLALVTTPRRRHADGFHFATYVCERIAEKTGIPFYHDAVQCLNHDRLHPDFMLLRPLSERRVIVYDDIITTGSTLIATNGLLSDRFVLNLISINNRQ